ncbi:hypothetical protein BD310DRAFT_545464 [Dichomitus squalens]|uniref:Uncharacterized protein n=1 Tax=Dichomitus squalens TaxID=114155 RepID=A0A4Q9PST4_9APHY|nr:hypothetical protein BD310DRAFT_545464 [Dichomitus squalens]
MLSPNITLFGHARTSLFLCLVLQMRLREWMSISIHHAYTHLFDAVSQMYLAHPTPQPGLRRLTWRPATVFRCIRREDVISAWRIQGCTAHRMVIPRRQGDGLA